MSNGCGLTLEQFEIEARPRPAEPEEVAAMYAFLANDQTLYIPRRLFL
jgi:hypothetical protein